MVERLAKIRTELGEVLSLTRRVLEDADTHQLCNVAPAVWEEIRATMERILGQNDRRMDDLITRGTPPPTEPSRYVLCHICLDALPSVALHPCGHTLCPACSHRVTCCPFCRAVINGRTRLFFDQ